MNSRLLCIAELISPGRGFVDVGTDHGYLPIYLAEKGYPGQIIASDINASPLQKAIDAAADAGLSQRIKFLLCDGLTQCPKDKIDTIVIAGMGGDTICHILDMTEWCMDSSYTLILQPMTKPEILRYWLTKNEFEIFKEELVEDNDKIYQLILARFGGITKLTDAELYLGKRSLCSSPELYELLRLKLVKRFASAIRGMEQNTSLNPPLGLNIFRQILKQLETEV